MNGPTHVIMESEDGKRVSGQVRDNGTFFVPMTSPVNHIVPMHQARVKHVEMPRVENKAVTLTKYLR